MTLGTEVVFHAGEGVNDPGDPVSGRCMLGQGEDIVYLGTDAGTVYAVDPSTATVRWSP